MADIECPYCGHEFDVCYDDGAHCTDGGRDTEMCPECEKYCLVETTLHYYHEARKADCVNSENAEEKDHEWYERRLFSSERGSIQEEKARICRACGKMEKLDV